jgi:hypothetical protein
LLLEQPCDRGTPVPDRTEQQVLLAGHIAEHPAPTTRRPARCRRR